MPNGHIIFVRYCCFYILYLSPLHLLLDKRSLAIKYSIGSGKISSLTKNYIWQHLINEIAKNCFGIATNRNGCCVLQSCIENAHGEARESLVNEIIANAVQLSENPYGFASETLFLLTFWVNH